ncbi:glycerophosphodiester phosphodiesterase [Streptomyces pacificus]|uniref:Glycerophosphodiester phosphodiesterase n=1 Tax=Streptomyces pacificus TaxID=2705029 RepID=A0A6A0ARU1_9ACTN|nr:glycerophosphodiester phosphodiesterase [Streptomyces pacificus]GFH35428.1 glycerophosphodiester phosphodiesterase [Streptomyces pacificus]
MRAVTAVGHRGDPYVARENTLPSLRAAIERGADAVEVDVRLTGDGVPVLLHDGSLKRLWGHDRPLSGLSEARLTELTGGGVPTLAAALAAASGHRLMLDLPGADASSARRVVGAVREGGAADRVYYTGGPAGMLAVRDADPDAEIALTWTTCAPPRPVLLASLRPRWLNYRFGLVSRDLADEVHAQGYLLSVWTADTRAAMRRLVDRGVDSITTNRVDALTRVLRGPRTGRARQGQAR